MQGRYFLCYLSMGLFVVFSMVENKILRAFVLWSVIRLLFTLSDDGISAINYIFMGVLVYQVMVNKFKKYGLEKALNCVCVLALLQTAMMYMQSFGYWLFIMPIGGGIDVFHNIIFKGSAACPGFMGNPNMAGAFLALCLPAFFRKKWCFIAPIIVWGLCSGNNLGGLIPAIIIYFMYVYFMRRDKKVLILTGIIAPLLAWRTIKMILSQNLSQLTALNSLSLADPSTLISTLGRKVFGIRWLIWSDVWHNIIPHHPIIGIGLGTFKKVYLNLAGIETKGGYQTHNDYLQVLVELGRIGLIICLGFVVCIYIKGLKFYKIDKNVLIALCGLSAGMINMIVNFPMHNNIGIFILMWAAMIEAQKKEGVKN